MKLTKKEIEAIKQIGDRAAAHGMDRTVAMMNITACHTGVCKLRLEELLNGRNFDFVHDLYGIDEYYDFLTDTLEECFWPRHAVLRKYQTCN